ncbi:CapA family protein [Streptomyces sp. NBC_00038]|uniref:CapA family protein n=1 Tax=Streptomyces sp. NBC_00038 TaxID=2903615 RepID=UPI0022592FDD|nr:CapA family protein [Streptomyces sp. NBC_00038]MCX5558486.1 CapA family protein [Streptomyces sp. NBC_00038]
MRSRRELLALGAAAALAGCGDGSQDRRPRPSTSSPAPPSPSATPRLPLVLAVHPTRAVGLSADRALFDDVRSGLRLTWEQLGGTGGVARVVRGPHAEGSAASSDTDAVLAVQRDPDTVAVVRADALGPGVAALPVDGHDPVTDPRGYPVTVDAEAGPGAVATTLWTGDIMLGRRVGTEIAASGDPVLPFSRTARRLAAADLTVGNLECTLSRAGPATQGGDSFAADPAALSGLREAGFDVLTLANNHLGDFGAEALRRTVSSARSAGFTTVGAGENLTAAREPAVVRVGAVRFGILAFNAIGETPAAGPTSAGAVRLRMPPRTGPLSASDLAALETSVRALRARADVVVVCPHWGEQYTHSPVAAQHTVARRLVDAGADAVIASHPHWVQGMELYKGSLVAHSLGNFVFDMTFSREVQQGVVLELVFWGAKAMAAQLLPVAIGARHVPYFLDPAGSEAREILADVWRTSGEPYNTP